MLKIIILRKASLSFVVISFLDSIIIVGTAVDTSALFLLFFFFSSILEVISLDKRI
jgi:hypothetical protein